MGVRWIIGAVMALAVMAGSGWARDRRVITEASPPFNFTVDGRITGSSTEVVRELLRRLGHRGHIEVPPWGRGRHMLQTQPNIALFSTARLEQREHLFHWVGPAFVHDRSFYARKGSGIGIQSLGDARAVGRIGTYLKDAKE